MNIWQWVYDLEDELHESGNSRLATLVEQVPHYAANNDFEKLKLVYPEALALARQYNYPWLEIFFRHWYLQNQVIIRKNTKGLLSEAVDLLEFSHRQDNKDCPQRICTVQDLAVCYQNTDGPGYAEERIEVSLETLSQIDSSWPCYTCIYSEYIDALIDKGDLDQALREIDIVRSELLKRGVSLNKTKLSYLEVFVHLEKGEYEQAEILAREATNHTSDHIDRKRKFLYHALCLGHLAQWEEADAIQVSFEDVLESPYLFDVWLKLQKLKIKNGIIQNTEELDHRFHLIASLFLKNGTYRSAINVALYQAELALERGAVIVAEICANRAESVRGQLNKDLGVSEKLADIRKRIGEINHQESVCQQATPEEFLELQFRSSDEALVQAYSALRQWPDDDRILVRLVEILDSIGCAQEALELLRKSFSLDRPRIVLVYGHILIDQGEGETFLKTFQEVTPESVSEEVYCNICWLFSRYYRSTDLKLSYEYLCKVIERRPQSRNATIQAAQSEQKLGYYDRAVSHWTSLIEQYPEETDFHWDRMVPATISENWPTVHESARVLGIELPVDEGPIYCEGGHLRLRFQNDNGEYQDYTAVRTGPVTAKVISLYRLGEEQRYGVEVVFDPVPRNQLDQEDEEGYPMDREGYYTYLYDVFQEIRKPKYEYFDLDGVHPGEEALKRIFKELDALDVFVQVRSSDDYEVLVDGSENAIKGLYAYMAVPESTDLASVNNILKTLIAKFEHPLIWPSLAEEAGDSELLKLHAQAEEKYNL
ncbi:hypothetical protein BTA51_11445 [Hahella sp. CCB-MM4]|uniref:tetratricopeptide repeat protein n=1 Tax=Hahella sp. (strain CCB-MM4) TaxID=1926491 RepID=UPI000B9B7586|nr:hypothetical protein [Hahella sp. CCB-MM4]OZG73104.1 hypothetical protein BTA51_11445 [Hahella sp. CCB-MM4]